MALAVKDLQASAQKWGQRAAAAAGDFQTGAVAAEDRWGRNTAAAAENYRTAISQANMMNRFARGVQRAVQSGKRAAKLMAVGQSRYSEGVSQSQNYWVQGFEPYQQTLTAVSLPSRRPRGDAQNYERSKAVGQALNAKRIALLAAGG